MDTITSQLDSIMPVGLTGSIVRTEGLAAAVAGFPAPVIARLPGWCLGGGLEVAAACDFRIAAHDAKFGMPEVRVPAGRGRPTQICRTGQSAHIRHIRRA